jgi:Putative beta barrel porin-7 (BBP7)
MGSVERHVQAAGPSRGPGDLGHFAATASYGNQGDAMNRSRLIVLLAVLAAAPLAQAQTPLPGPAAEVSFPAARVEPEVSLGGAATPDPSTCMWVNAEYLLWWMSGQVLPPLVTTSPAGTSIANAGILGTPGATVLFGDSSTNTGARSGARLGAGGWIDANQTLGAETDFLFLQEKITSFAAASAGTPILARPVVNSLTGTELSARFAFPGNLAGGITANSSSNALYGGEILLRETLGGGENFRIDVVGGWRILHFSDGVTITSNLTSLSGASPIEGLIGVGTQIATGDQFLTSNTYNGFGVGLSGEFSSGPLVLQLDGKISAGLNQEGVDINGATTITVPGAAKVQSVGGLLALPTNIGHFSRNQGSVVPEFNCRLAYQVTPNVRATLGYSLLIWDDVVRAGDQINRFINPTFVPGFPGGPSGASNPIFPNTQNNLYIQGLTLGMEVRF